MACCLTAPSHYLKQCWLIIKCVLWHSPEGSFTGNAQDVSRRNHYAMGCLLWIFWRKLTAITEPHFLKTTWLCVLWHQWLPSAELGCLAHTIVQDPPRYVLPTQTGHPHNWNKNERIILWSSLWWIHSENIKNIFAFSQHWDATGSWKPSSWRTSTCLS